VSYLKNWYDKSPPGFTFSVKVPRLITHYKQFKDSARMLDDFYNSVSEGLGAKLGAVLFQLPPQAIYTEERLEKILRNVKPGFNNVIEFRHSSWWKKQVMKILAERNIVFSGCSYPGLPDEPVINNELVYYRFHGVPVIY
jgi:uncharacterized protein YecE (DUF72 family)